MIYFNWEELLYLSKKDMAGILCLLHGLNPEYYEYNSTTMMRRLSINHVPIVLFKQKCFKQINGRLLNLYKTKEPQGYIKNIKFLYLSVPVKQKITYIRALSMRRLNNKDDFIPRSYFSKVTSNIFLDIQEDRIYFPYESS